MKLSNIRERYSNINVKKDYTDPKADLKLSVIDKHSLSRFVIGCTLVSLGIFTAATGGSWDITNHLLNKPESFFSAPHAMLYAGVASAILGCVIMCKTCKSMHSSNQSLHRFTKLVISGIMMLVIAGPVDFEWHSSFGLDGLLSPPHFVLLMGMVISSTGSLLGIIICTNRDKQDDVSFLENVSCRKSWGISGSLIFLRPYIPIVLLIIGIMPIWLSLEGVIGMFSLPFSKTQYFDFNPDPSVASVLATVSYPFLLSFMLTSSFRLGKNNFGMISIVGSIYLAVNSLTLIIPSESLIPTLPFYIINLVPIIAVDVLLSVWKDKFPYCILLGGAILGSTFFMMQYPLITHIYNEVITKQAFVWPSQTSSIYFGMIGNIYTLIIAPGIAMGIIGAIAANRIIEHSCHCFQHLKEQRIS
jgi:hypothetical protein